MRRLNCLISVGAKHGLDGGFKFNVQMVYSTEINSMHKISVGIYFIFRFKSQQICSERQSIHVLIQTFHALAKK